MQDINFTSLNKWLKSLGIITLSEFAAFVKEFTDGTVRDILNKAHGCYIYDCL